MPNKMERFTPRAQHVLSLTQAEAERMGHGMIGTEHLLLGMMREDGGVAGRVLRDLGVESRRLADLIAELTQTSTQSTSKTPDLSPGMKRVLELAVDEARRMGHHHIGTEHLLLGLVRQSDGVAMDVLKRLGINPVEVRRQTRRVLQQEQRQAEQPSPIFQLEFIERFRQRAKFALSLALDYAEQMQHSQIDTGHLLIGLMREESGAAGRVLRDLGVEQRKMNELVAELTPATPRTSNQALDLSPDLKWVLELAVEEAQRLAPVLNQQPWEVGTESLLLALVRHEENVAVNVLKQFDVSPEDVRRQTRGVLQARRDGRLWSSARQRRPTNPILHIRIMDDETGLVKADFKLSFNTLHNMVQLAGYRIDQRETSKVVWNDKDHSQHIEIDFIENMPPSTESGDSDAQ